MGGSEVEAAGVVLPPVPYNWIAASGSVSVIS